MKTEFKVRKEHGQDSNSGLSNPIANVQKHY